MTGIFSNIYDSTLYQGVLAFCVEKGINTNFLMPLFLICSFVIVCLALFLIIKVILRIFGLRS